VLKNNSWRSNKHNGKKRTNAEHGEENVQVKALAYESACLCIQMVDRI